MNSEAPAKARVPAKAPKPQIGSIFHQDWWMTAASHCDWGKVEINEPDVRGILPYIIYKHHLTTRIGMPLYSRVLGPVMILPASKPVTYKNHALDVITQLMSKLPRHDSFCQRMEPENEQSLAFVMAGYRANSAWRVEQDYTFRIGLDVPTDVVLRNMFWRTRSHVLRYKTRLEVHMHDDIQEFIHMAKLQAAGEGRKLTHRFDILTRCFDAAFCHGQATILTARHETGIALASAVLVWDSRNLYFWQGTRKIAPGNYAYSFVIWKAICFAKSLGLTFDFDGFHTPGAAKYLASFGGVPAPRPWIIRHNLRFRALLLARDAMRQLAGVAPQSRW